MGGYGSGRPKPKKKKKQDIFKEMNIDKKTYRDIRNKQLKVATHQYRVNLFREACKKKQVTQISVLLPVMDALIEEVFGELVLHRMLMHIEFADMDIKEKQREQRQKEKAPTN